MANVALHFAHLVPEDKREARLFSIIFSVGDPEPALADAGPNARPKRGAPLNSDFMTSSCSVNRVTIVVERKYAVTTNTRIEHVC